MRFLLVLLCLAAPALARAACAPDGPPWITLEIVAGEPAKDEAAQWIEVRRDGCLTVRHASWDVRRGVYQYVLSAAEMATLEKQVTTSGVDTLDAEALKTRLAGDDRSARTAAAAAGKPAAIFAVSDGDTYRLQIEGAGTKHLIAWYAPREEARRRPQVAELAKLVGFFDTVQALALSERRTRTAEVQP